VLSVAAIHFRWPLDLGGRALLACGARSRVSELDDDRAEQPKSDAAQG
jgi:hypothetical protein